MENEKWCLNEERLLAGSKEYNFCWHEKETFEEILQAVKKLDQKQLDWFSRFGDSLRKILLNVYAFRKGLGFGFEVMEFDAYGWLKRPVFLDQEELKFGDVDKSRFGNYSSSTLGCGLNGKWCFGLSISYGTAGSSFGLSVYNEVFGSRSKALAAGLAKLKKSMEEKVGDGDTSNFNQRIISATLKEIEQFRYARVQLSLF